MVDWIVVGAGFTGATVAERIASVLDQRVLVIDRRDHLAGNAFDCPDANGIIHHRYGPHIFHTNSRTVWDYLSRFTDWRPYHHEVLAVVEGRQVPVPFNLDSIAALFPPHMADALARRVIDAYGYGRKVPILRMRASDDAEIRFLADYVYAHVFETYTAKQWGLRPDELDPSVTARVPFHVSRDPRYFQDTYQAMPRDGYVALFARMLAHRNIELALNTEFRDARRDHPAARVVFTGPIDEFFDHAHGPLPYRSLRFVHRSEDEAFVQRVGTVNYPNDHAFTRITEMKRLTGQSCRGTLLMEEYPEAYEAGRNEPYYPVPTPASRALLEPYLAAARALEGKVWFAGRLGDYAYYNMDQACARALALFAKSLSGGV